MATISVNDVEMYYEVRGEGSPVLFIAGLMSDSSSWESVADLFAQNYKVILVDNRGVGQTKPLDVNTSIELIADDCILLLDYLEIDKISIVGHSMGGFIGMDIASRFPDRVNNLVLAATATRSSDKNIAVFDKWVEALRNGQDQREWFGEVFQWIFTDELLSNSAIREMFLDYSINYPFKQSAAALKNQVDALREFDFSDRLGTIKARTLIVCGDSDKIFSVEDSIGSLSAIAGSKSIVISGAAHAIHAEKDKEFVDCVSEFLG